MAWPLSLLCQPWAVGVSVGAGRPTVNIAIDQASANRNLHRDGSSGGSEPVAVEGVPDLGMF